MASVIVIAQAACGALSIFVGVLGVFASQNLIKQIGGAVAMIAGATVVLAALGAPPGLLMGAVAGGAAWIALTTSIVVRMQEAFASVEGDEIEAVEKKATLDSERSA